MNFQLIIFIASQAFFENYFTDDLITNFIENTNLYAVQNNGANFPATTKNEIKTFLGIHILLGVMRFPSVNLYWEPNLRIPLVCDNMTTKLFFKLRQNVHLVEQLR